MKISIAAASLGGLLLLGGCATMTETQKDTTTGAAIGAASGAVIGAVAGGKKGALIGAGVGAAAGAGGGYLWSRNMQSQRQAMEEATAGTGVAVSQTEDNQLKVEMPGDISFDTGRADIKPEMRPVLNRLADTLQGNPAANVRVVGHTDSTGSDAVNQPLSQRRAGSVRDYLVDRGVSASRITSVGRGSAQPIADNSTSEGRARNRRVEIFVAEAAG